MDELTAPQQNRLLAGLSNLLRRVEQDSGPEFLPRGLDVMGLVRQLALPSAETVEKMSYGDPLFRMPTQSNIPITTDRGYLAEVLGLAPAASAASRATTRLSNEAADALVRQITRNPEATAPRVLEETAMPFMQAVVPKQIDEGLLGSLFTPTQKQALDSYIESSAPFNDALRGEGPKLGQQGLAIVKELDSLFKTSPRLEEDLIVYRAVPEFTYNKSKDIDRGFVSATKNLQEAEMFLEEYGLDKIVRIKIPKGTPIVEPGRFYPGYNYQDEVLLPRNGVIIGEGKDKVFNLNEVNLVDSFLNKAQKFPSNYTDITPRQSVVQVEQLIPTQKKVSQSAVDAYKSGQGSMGDLPVDVVFDTKNNQYLVVDGHHRVAAMIESGVDRVPVQVIGEK